MKCHSTPPSSLIVSLVLTLLLLQVTYPTIYASQTREILPSVRLSTDTINPLTGGSEMGPISAGWLHTCAVTSTGGVMCWGENDYGQLGNNTTTDSAVPVQVAGLSSGVRAVAMGRQHTCALTVAGGVLCWGGGVRGQLGNGSYNDSKVPVSVTNLPGPVSSIAAGFFHTCALTTAGAMLCWGYNGFDQLGDNSNSDRRYPVGVIGLSSGVAGIAAGFNFTCALTTGGRVKCWGRNENGELGNGSTTNSPTPSDVVNLSSEVAAIAAGDAHTCALLATGAVQCWGSNNSGQLGMYPSAGSTVPVSVGGIPAGAIAIASGGFHNCVQTAAGAMMCWGGNGSGELGNDSGSSFHFVPVDVLGLSSGVGAMATGQVHTCAQTTYGGLKCWGQNFQGELGTGSFNMGSRVPLDVVVPPPPGLTIDYTTGRPGSFFTVTGANYPASGKVALSINDHTLAGTVAVDAGGNFRILLSTSHADEGWYRVSASVVDGAAQVRSGTVAFRGDSSGVVYFTLDDSAPLRPQTGDGQTLDVPPGIAITLHKLHLPLVVRN